MLKIRSLHAAYGRIEALHGVDLDVNAGEVVCLVGRNGVGKTSTMRAIVQEQIRVTKGTVEFNGVSVVGQPSHDIINRGIGYVPEDRRAFASLTVADNLRVVRQHRGKGASTSAWTVDRVYALFPHLAEARKRLAGVLSGGEQQMLSMARSLLTNPRLLLLDEPNEGLAPKIIDEIIGAIHKLKQDQVSMLVSEQSLRTIRACGDRVVVIDRGASVFHGTAAEFLGNPDIARQYLMVAGH
jgi:branched-chain amino acid transport system ATP-binding protein